ncbi:hypothetical protein [Paenibacillus sinopodophylli]|uniref:hypothetical protein n=1 Tax=Paenibacillus sinopodophylli TaxID=1837342 RepID=UPI00110CF8A0|nr:hypothetical protein [Paenibacillus sinopodophylli]
MTLLHWHEGEQGTEFYLNGRKVGTAVNEANSKDSFVLTEEGVVSWQRSTKTPMTEMTMRFEADFGIEYYLIPALQYNGNTFAIQDFIDVRNAATTVEQAEIKEEPTYFANQREPESGLPWRFGWHRMSVPGASYSEGSGMSAGGFLPAGQLDGACSVYEENGGAVHEWLWPEQDGPLPVFTDGKRNQHYRKPISPRNEFSVMLVFVATERPRESWSKLLDEAWKQNYVWRAPMRSNENLWELGIQYAKLLYTEEADGFKGFSIGFIWENETWMKRSVQKYEIGWCGQNASIANSLLVHSAMVGDKEAAEMAISVLDAWLAAAGPTGLIPTHYDDNMYTNGHAKTTDACNLGTAAVQLFEAERNAELLGIDRPAYGQMAMRICDFALKVMDDSGRIGKSWLESDLSPAVKDGGTGAFLTMALCEAAKATGSERYLSEARRSHAYYMTELQQSGYTTAGALDIFSIDKESCIPLLKSSMLLHDITGDPSYLACAERAAWYLSTWQWHFTKPFPEESLLGQLDYDTFGGTAVSIHGGMDPFALCYVHELCDLAALTGHSQWHERAGAIWRHGQQGISDGDLRLDGKSPRPVGSQDESCNYTYGKSENTPTQWLVAWPAAFRLEALRKILPVNAEHGKRIF